MENGTSNRIVRIFAILIVIAGLIGSLGLMFYAGRYNRSVILILLFTGWVSSPFLALLIAVFSKRLQVARRKPLYLLMIFISVVSLIVYSGAFGLRGPHPAFVFLVVPLISWLMTGIISLVAIRKKIT